jgi:hypothetical protein
LIRARMYEAITTPLGVGQLAKTLRQTPDVSKKEAQALKIHRRFIALW